jgi:TfoX/Sxy family transcriptional regulator of competence genes
MPWKKVPPELSRLLDQALASLPAQKRLMFGGPAWFTAGGNLFAAAHQHNVILRLSEQDRLELLAESDEVALFEPMPGRPMKEYVALPESLYIDAKWLDKWLHRSFNYANTLPIKEKKPGTRGSKRGKA